MDSKSSFYRIFIYSDTEAERAKKNSPYSLPKVFVRGVAKEYTSVHRQGDVLPSDARKIVSGDFRSIKTIQRKIIE